MKLYGGIDLHANNSVVAILDEQDHPVYPISLVILPINSPERRSSIGIIRFTANRLSFCAASVGTQRTTCWSGCPMRSNWPFPPGC